jgi:hypothetical protein
MFEYLINIYRKEAPYYASNNKVMQQYQFKKSGTLLSTKRNASKHVQEILSAIHLLESTLNGGISYNVHLDVNICMIDSDVSDKDIWLASQHLSFNPKKERCCNTQDSKWYTTHRGELQSFREKHFPELALDSGDLLKKFISLS